MGHPPADRTTFGLKEATVVYIGPDALMPLASALAAIVGFLLMFWRRVAGAMRMLFGRVATLFGKR